MDDHLLACQQIFEKVPHSNTLVKERASFLKVNDINGISFLGFFFFIFGLTVIIVVL
jgi:hypothetical protein